ncbi:MAG: PEP-CTERM sorting domain-containing protein [Gammaproteobacteria bacterium]
MKNIALTMALLGSIAATPASAAIQTVNGSFFDISYDDSLTGLFGTPTIVGNTVQWFPSGLPGFSAYSAGDGIQKASSTFALTIAAKPDSDYKLTNFELQESGDYSYFGSGTVGVGLGGQLRVTPLDPSSSTVISPIANTGTFTANAPLDFSTKDWNATAAVDTTGLTKANVTIENLLFAYTPPGSFPTQAFIEKKEAFLHVTVVPEAQTYMMLLAGLGLIGTIAYRRRQSQFD